MLVRRTTPVLAAVAVLGGLLTVPAAAVAAPDQEMPFTCAEQWTGSSRARHSPSSLALDFNRPSDLGRIVLSSASGTVARVEDAGSRSYGKWITVDHGGGYATLYAHLKAQWVVPGQFVDRGTPIGRVGDSGNVTGAHLHYEQKLGRSVIRAVFGRSAFPYGSTVASANCPDVPVGGDWNGDGKEEIGTFRRGPGLATFSLQGLDPAAVVRLGNATDWPLVGDWDGDGTTDTGVRRAGIPLFVLRKADGTLTRVRYGLLKDRPVAGDWDGDGVAEVGVWRPSRTHFRLRRPDGTTQVIRLGSAGSQPVTGDWDGDGTTDVGVFDAALARFTLSSTVPGGTPVVSTVTMGSTTDLPVTGDWNGDGVTDVGTWNPMTATFSLRLREGHVRTVAFGLPR